MAIIHGTNDTTQSDSTETTSTTSDSCEDCSGEGDLPEDSGDGFSGLVGRLVDLADRAATLIEPFAALLTAIVQAATVATLIQKA